MPDELVELNKLVEAVKRHTEAQKGTSPFVTAVPGLTLLRSDHPKPPSHLIFKPALWVVVQGAKWAIFGDTRLAYKAGQALMVSVETPGFGAVTEATAAEPYLSLVIEFDLGLMRDVMEGMNTRRLDDFTLAGGAVKRGVLVTNFDGPLADCALRLVRLLDAPQAIPILYPAIMREICYWLLSGPESGEVIQMALAGSHARCVLSAIHCLRERFSEPVRIEELASVAHLSPSAFHRQFKSITSMTPLQYQKQLRLLEARRLMVAEEATVETAALQVGYESSSQFSREYSRMFGLPPRRDAVLLRSAVA